MKSEIREIETLRHHDPTESLAKAWVLAEAASGIELGMGLGEVASSLRALGKIPEAHDVLDVAFYRVGSSRKARSVCADLTRRRSLLEVSSANFPAALAIGRQAVALATSVDARFEIGRAYLAISVSLHWQGRYSESNEANESAVLFLDDPYYGLIAHLGTAMNWLYLGEMEQFEAALSCATEQKVSPKLRPLYQWVAAERDLALGRYSPASETFRYLANFYFESDQFTQCALASLLATRCFIEKGDFGKAVEIAGAMANLVFCLEANPVAENAVGAIVLESRRGVEDVFRRELKIAEAALRRAAARPKLPFNQPPPIG